jgi:hypothetical protein
MPIDFETQKGWWPRFDMDRYMGILKARNYQKYRFFMLYFYGINVKPKK